MSALDHAPSDPALHCWMWRWHGYAGLFIVPFIFWMSLTGLPYVWENELEDLWHPEYRALTPQAIRVSYERQLETARGAGGGQPLLAVKLDADPRHATQFIFGSPTDPVSVFVNPYSGNVITTIREWTRLSFAAISLHGLTFIKPFGSWLLELCACWGLLLCASGVYLWWPRGAGKVWGVFLPRLRAGGRTRWRDLHAVTGFYFAAVLALYLLTGLPWTAFWGGQLLASAQAATGQGPPAAITGNPGLPSGPPAPGARRLPLDDFAGFALARHLPGPLFVELPASDTATVHVYNRLKRQTAEEHFQLDAYSGRVVRHAAWRDVPLTAKVVALGIDLHEGALFGRVTQVLSTCLAGVFMFVAAAGALAWYRRRPQGRLDLPRIVPRQTLPRGLQAMLVALGLFLPLLGLSLVLLTLATLWRGERTLPAPL